MNSRTFFKIIQLLLYLLLLFNASESRFRRSQHHHICRKESQISFKEREILAKLIFTGTVSRIYKSHSRVYRGIVRIKRVLKGDRRLSDSHVIIDGFGNSKLCKSEVKERDTRIFLVNRVNGRLTLNSSLIRVNVNNLRKVVAAVKSK
ncbi:agrin-like protein [Leptotrombidium deliense]|uniref:Agrin-like protein n=1 Tax=Leptotrombidium deliense TaxID=299467 RepID=A0A443S701_9ACAR|nr:agrin-like protein [Leptotrombidium deliense]